MKKRIALLVGILILLTAVFAACSKTPTEKKLRWGDRDENGKYVDEHLVYNITLADFSADSEKTLFNKYPNDNKDYYKDTVINSQESINMGNADEIRPVAAKGTYIMDIKDVGDNYKIVTEQTLYVQYETAKLKELNCLDTLKDYVVPVTDEKNPFPHNSTDRTTLKSVTKTEVVFGKDDAQAPVSSKIENHGFYIGKTEQSASEYSYETTYDFSKRKVSVKIKNGDEAEKTEERKLGIRKKTTCIDSAQLLLYIRSLDKSDNAFQDSPSVSVYNPVSDKVATASFALSREFNAALNNGGENIYTKINAVSVVVGSTPFMTQFNLPDLSGVGEKGLDCLGEGATAKMCKFTTVKFRAGCYSYELSSYDADLVAALKNLAK